MSTTTPGTFELDGEVVDETIDGLGDTPNLRAYGYLMSESAETLAYYASPGVMTDLARHANLLTDAPTDPRAIAAMIQGLILHPFWAAGYGVEGTDARQAELGIRGATGILDGVLAIDNQPFTVSREPGDRFLGNCRDFSTLTVAFLRRAGTPARARCGFGGYFEKNKWVDHWIVEHWNGERWITLDAQIDDFQREVTGLDQDPADLPPGYFLSAPDAWLRCRRGEEDPNQFGIMDMWGDWFIASNIGRDIAALNKVEMLPWDDWGALAGDEHTRRDDSVVDEIAAMICRGDADEIRARYATDTSLQVTAEISSLGPTGEWGPTLVPELQ